MSSNPNHAIAHLFSFKQVTGSTHKQIGLENVLTEYPKTKAFCLISSGNRWRDLKRVLEENNSQVPIYVLVNEPHSWNNEIIIQSNRILRDAKEREEYVSEHTSIAKEEITDVTDFSGSELVSTLKSYIATRGFNKVFTPLGSGGLYLAACEAVNHNNTQVVGFMPRGENGIFTNPEIDYEMSDGKLYYKKFNPKSLADKLVCPYTARRESVLDTLKQGHRVIEFDEEQLKQAYVLVHTEFGGIEPSSVAGAIGLTPSGWDEKIVEGGDKVLILITGTNIQTPYEDRTELRLTATPDSFNFIKTNNYGDADTHRGTWGKGVVEVSEYRSYWGQPHSFLVELDSMIAKCATDSCPDNLSYNLLTQQYLNDSKRQS